MRKLSRWAVVGLLGGFALVAGACTQPARANQVPIAVITATPDAGDPPLEVEFSSAGTADPDGTISSHSWDFGDGSPLSTAANPVHTFTATGDYTVRLTVTDNRNFAGSATKVIHVGPGANASPVAVISATPSSGKAPLGVTFVGSGSSDPDGSIASVEWDFGDGTPVSSELDTFHEFTTPGLYTVTLTVLDNDGAGASATKVITVNANQAPTAVAGATPTAVRVGQTVTFSSTGSNDPDGTIASYSWNFGDGSALSSAPSPTHAYATVGTKTATLTVTDNNGLSATDTVDVVVTANPAPTAAINANVASGQGPLTVQFNGSASSDDGSIAGYLWNFGGGNTATVVSPSFTFTGVGAHAVTLTVTDNEGATGSDTFTVTIDPVPNVAPVAAAAATTPKTGKAPLSVNFSSAGSHDNDGGITGYSWSFSDGGSSSSANPTHVFTNPGTYTATLTVTDGDGATGSASVTGIVAVPNQAPTAAAGATPLTVKEDKVVTFSSAGSVDGDGTIVPYGWTFGDGGTSTAQNPTHAYANPGSYTATLTVTDNNGAAGTATVAITVQLNQAPTAVANATPQSGPSPLNVAFSSAASTDDGTIVSYAWAFGDGGTSTLANPSHTYAVGSYTATLTVTDDGGRTGAATVGITADAAGLDAPTSPVVTTGASLPTLVGTSPGQIVAFKFNLVSGAPVWTQVPVQVDQRKVVAFGYYPSTANTYSGTEGTVYGNSTGGASFPLQATETALQYADATTWVGPDTNTNFDADDELVFMAFDAGGQVQGANPGQPAGVVAGSGVAVQVDETRADGGRGWVYLFRSTTLSPAAGKDYVQYSFNLTSGAYRTGNTTTYKRWWVAGPPGNPETSSVTTPSYQIAFTDRWKETDLKVKASGASQADILDANKVQLMPNTANACVRSNKTMFEGEGAFVANIDGPVRAIRSYVGANSGPNTQHTHFMYRDRKDVVFKLRVHSVPSFMDFVDYNSAASGMTYRSSTVPGGVAINGVNDTVPAALPTWEAVNGPQGTVLSTMALTSSVQLGVENYYRDLSSPNATTDPQCWGDTSLYGASGMYVTSGVPDTDPHYTNPPASVQWVRSTTFGSPVADPSTIPAKAADFQQDVANPFLTTVTPYTG